MDLATFKTHECQFPSQKTNRKLAKKREEYMYIMHYEEV